MDSFSFTLGPLAISGEGHFAITIAAVLSAVLIFKIVRAKIALPALWRIKPSDEPPEGDDH